MLALLDDLVFVTDCLDKTQMIEPADGRLVEEAELDMIQRYSFAEKNKAEEHLMTVQRQEEEKKREVAKEVRKVEERVNSVSSRMRENIAKVVDRSEAMDDLEERAESLAASARSFSKKAKKSM